MFARQLDRCAHVFARRGMAEHSFKQGSVSLRCYQTGANELEPWPHAASDITEAETPPSSWYTSPIALQAELATVFRRSWQFLGASGHLQHPGDYLSSLVKDSPFVACIDQAGKLRAYHNVCRHHAAAVCEEGHGNTDQFQCPYHGWEYGLDGRLQKASKLKGIRNFRASDKGLLPVDVATWQGFTFINAFNKRAVSLPDWLGAGGQAMAAAGISLQGMQHMASRTYHLKCNWKVFCDNYLLDSYSSKSYERLSIQTCEAQDPFNSSNKRLGSRAAAYAFLYPNIMLNRYGPWLDMNVVEPTGPESCQVRFEYFLEQDAGKDAAYVQESIEGSHEVQLEDVKLCEAVQRGLRSPAYDTGRYAPSMEQPMLHFHQLLHGDLFAQG